MKNTTLCYLTREDRVLLLHRIKKKEDVNAGKWIGIGGHFEEGESPFDCAIREVFEETGFALTSLAYRGVVTFVSDVCETEQMHLFTSDGFLGDAVIPLYEREGDETDTPFCDEGRLAWVKKEDLSTLPMWEGDAVFLRLLSEKEPFFSLKLVYEGDRLVKKILNGIPL